MNHLGYVKTEFGILALKDDMTWDSEVDFLHENANLLVSVSRVQLMPDKGLASRQMLGAAAKLYGGTFVVTERAGLIEPDNVIL